MRATSTACSSLCAVLFVASFAQAQSPLPLTPSNHLLPVETLPTTPYGKSALTFHSGKYRVFAPIGTVIAFQPPLDIINLPDVFLICDRDVNHPLQVFPTLDEKIALRTFAISTQKAQAVGMRSSVFPSATRNRIKLLFRWWPTPMRPIRFPSSQPTSWRSA